jgi:hypothetical protein
VELSVEQVGGPPPTIIGPGGSGEATVSCDKGEVVAEGVFESDIGFQPNTSQPDENIWIVDGRNTWNTEIALIAVALCA